MPEGGTKTKKNKKNRSNVKPKDGEGDRLNDQSLIEQSNEQYDNISGTRGVDTEATNETTDGGRSEKIDDIHDSLNASTNTSTGDETAKESAVAEPPSSDRFDALVRDRDSLRAEVTDMRKSLEEIQSKHYAEMETLQQKLADAESKKDHAETQFQKLLERVNTIKAQLGERLKEDAEELALANSKIEELEEHNSSLKEELDSRNSEVTRLSKENEQKTNEIATLRTRTTLSQQNWLKEKKELLEQESYLQSEFEQAKEAMHNWEVLAMEERSIREGLGEKVIDLEEQLATLRDAHETVTADRNSQLATVDGLQRALQEIQIARKQELRELVESSNTQLEELRHTLQGAENKATEAEKALQAAQQELERVRPFEKEVKEKNLLIGKLRHEAVTLNDHLTKALRFLKKGRAEDNVDRHIVTNHLLHFLALDRSDPKKFQILQLIAALLGWTDEQREQAGLARPGASSVGGKLKVPSISMHRTPSTPTLATEFMDNGHSSKESLAELWSNFLEQESQANRNQETPKP
ncbi:putative Golgi matrix protein [Aspergillus clavatus NRRL 1]|uniref:Golgi matrix protein, putative n=1 Tax=Aspergillus clavatus (strain ATCC 1007 / CBS 513.65 / DSM 816 / NCTC 3887 / NRRL 1 / QM 1276 / 107) TaxID=344612 RepID=A1CQM9_ASPCL|nr:Golgi matrix protein, putative [Aspergillus clavatus NRRL 1]EAW07950.1 Golgi matrix protein, putative [Aspergillus clavatus NRRL 1]